METNLQKTIFITGTSSGIGKATALYLASQGFMVLASVRKASDAAMLNDFGLRNLKPVYPLDLTKKDDLNAVAEMVKSQLLKKEIPPLYGVIFIAGGGHIVPIEIMNMDYFRGELEKRLTGNLMLLQYFIPFLRLTKGRILWISTPGLFPVPFIADIHAPDFAVNYLARTLNIELRPDGIRNILIRCGGINTTSPKRTETNIVAQLEGVSEAKINIYRDRLEKLEEGLKSFATNRTEPEIVAKTIEKALNAKNPKTRYPVGYLSKMGGFLEMLPQSWVDFIMEQRAH